MSQKRKKPKPPTEKYLTLAKALPKLEAERLMSRMRGKFSRRWEDEKLTRLEVFALQLEYEDETLAEWRRNVAKLKQKHKD